MAIGELYASQCFVGARDRARNLFKMNLVNLAGSCVGQLREKGYSAIAVQDREEAAQRLFKIGKSALTPVMSPAHNDFTEKNSFALFLTKDGQDAAGLLVRHDDIGSETVESYWSRIATRAYAGQGANALSKVANPLTRHMGGKLIYLGDLHRAKKDRGSIGVLMPFIQLTHCLAYLEYEFDWVYAFMRPRDVETGFAVRYGFTWSIPNAQTWAAPAEGRVSEEYLVAASREDVEYVIECRASSLSN